MIVFNKGIIKALKGSTPLGGHITPNSIFTDKLEWKKAQKNETKNITSDTINKTIPQRIPNWTFLAWNPFKVLSFVTSLHQFNIRYISKINLKDNNNKDLK